MISGEAANTNFIVFPLIRPRDWIHDPIHASR